MSRSLINQFTQLRGSLNYEDSITYNAALAETAGREYLTGTLAVVSGSATVTDSSNDFERQEQGNFIVIDTGPAAGVYQILTSAGSSTATVTPTPTADDASVSYRRHYYKNLEDDLNYVRTMLKKISGESNWYDDPSTSLSSAVSDISTNASDIITASGVLQDQITTNAGNISTNAGDISTNTGNISALDTKIDTASGTLQQAIDDLDTATSSEIIWEVVDTPTDQIRPKLEHQGKAMYTAGDLTIGGNLTVSGTSTIVHSEELTVADKTITVNAGEVGAGLTGSQYAGIEIDRGSETNYMFVFDEVQDNFRVGISGSLQAVATREDSPIDTRVPYWNSTDVRFDTAGDTYMTIVSGTVDLAASGDSVFNATSSAQRLGKSSGAGRVEVADSSVTASVGGAQVLALYESIQWIGVSGDTFVSLNQSSDSISLISGNTTEVLVNTSGFSLKTGTSVNEISTAVSVSSTDDQLATAKAVYDADDVLDSKIDTASGTLQSQITDNAGNISTNTGNISSISTDLTNNYYTSSAVDGLFTTHSTSTDHDGRYYTQSEVDDMISSISGAIGGDLSNYYTKAQIDTTLSGYYDASETDSAISSALSGYYTSGQTDSAISSALVGYATTAELTSTSGVLQDQIDSISMDHGDLTGLDDDDHPQYLTRTDFTTHSGNSDIHFTEASIDKYTQTEVDNLLAAQDEFLELADVEVTSYTSGNMLYTTGSGVADTSNMTYDPAGTVNVLDLSDTSQTLGDTATYFNLYDSGLTKTATLKIDSTTYMYMSPSGDTVRFGTSGDNITVAPTSNQTTIEANNTVEATFDSDGLSLKSGASVNEIVTTIASGVTNDQLPTAQAVWELTELAAASVHTHYDVDAVYVSDTSWTYGTTFSGVPSGLAVFVNGVKQRDGAANDYTSAVPGGVLTLTFNYDVTSSEWVNLTYYE